VLTQKIATDNLADAFMAFNTNYHDTGLFGVYAVTDRERSGDLSWVVMNEVSTHRVVLFFNSLFSGLY
jgi:processing peptidase subunit beta